MLPSAFLSGLPISTNVSLWGASEDNWWRAKTQSNSTVVTYSEYVDEWNSGKVADVGAYEKMLLVACRHVIGTSSLTAPMSFT